MTNGKEQYMRWIKRIGRMLENRNVDVEKLFISKTARQQMFHVAYPNTVKEATDDIE